MLKARFLLCVLSFSLPMPAMQLPGIDPVLVNGRIYTYHVHPETTGHQFLTDKTFMPGWLKIRDRVYENQSINYDVFHQQLILKYISPEGVSRQLIVSDAWLQSFGYDNMTFQYLPQADGKIFQVLGDEPCSVYYHWTKTLDLSKVYGSKNFVFSKPKKEMFLAIAGARLRYSGNRSFVSHIRSQVNDEAAGNVRSYLKKNNINVRKAEDRRIEELLAYCGKFILLPAEAASGRETGQAPSRNFAVNSIVISGTRIFYKDNIIDTTGITIQDSSKIISSIDRTLTGTGFTAAEWNNSVVVVPGDVIISSLPDYIPVTVTSDSAGNDGKKKMTGTEAAYLTSRSPDVTEVITVGSRGAGTTGGKARVLGRITDGDTGEPLMSVPVYISELNSGAVTDADGFVIMTLSPATYNARIEYLGYAPRKFILEVLSDGSFTQTIHKAAIRLQDVVVTAEAQAGMRMKMAGLDQVPVRNIKSMPVMMGEQDVLKVSVTLPGIVSAGEGAAGLNVRGSGYDQNAFYINRIPVYNTSHLFGFFSSFNSDVIRDFSIYKGFIPVQYGGRLASVFNITARQGNRKHFTALGGVSPVAGNLTVEGPVGKEAGSFIVSGRTSYSDWILERLKDTTLRSSRANFNDISGGLNLDNEKSQLSVFFYHSFDNFRLAEITHYDYSNNGASVILAHTYGNALRSEFSLSGSVYGFTTSDRLEPSSSYTHSYRLGHYDAHAIFRHVLNESHTLEYGSDVTLYDLDRGNVRPYDDRSLRNRVSMDRERGLDAALFISDLFSITPSVSLEFGLRYGLFIPVGPAEVYEYMSGMPIDLRYITDTLFFGRNKAVKKYHEPDVRVSANIRTGENGSVKAAFNQMHQNIFMLNTAISLAPNTQWKLADFYLRPAASNLYSVGYYHSFPARALEASAEIYYKAADNYPEFRDGADFLKNPRVETLVLQGRQEAYGIEFYLKRSNRKFEGWISYAFSRSVIKVDGPDSWDRINNGRTYPLNFDIPNSISAVLSYHFTRRVILSSVFTYQTGKPVTYPESVYYINGSQYLDYSARNAYRIPDYVRTDLSLTIEGNLKAGKPVHSSYIFNLYNATGRMNPYSVFFRSENGRIKSYIYSVVGVPVFTATWRFKLGNYASD